PRADLYAAAIVMFEMLTGITPFDAPNRDEMMVRTAQLDEAPPPVSRLVPGAPAALDLVFARALAKNRDLRYGTARELGDAFRNGLGLPDSAGWKAQQELSKVAKTLSMVMPVVDDLPPSGVAATAEDAPALPQRTSQIPAKPAVAQAQAEAERYATD